MADLPGISYMRTTREKTPKLYDPSEEFPIGGSKTLRSAAEDRVALVGAGVTVFEALAAAERLAAEGISARVIDCYSIKPIDADTCRRALAETGLVVTVEDHWPEGGIGDAVLEALASTGAVRRVRKIAVTERLGTPEELRTGRGSRSQDRRDRAGVTGA
jgi:transketolase